MKIKILEYKAFKGNHVKVQSHNHKKGKWKKNKNYEWHKRVSSGDTMIQGMILWSHETERRVNQ